MRQCVIYEKRAIKSAIKSLDLDVCECVYTNGVGDGDNDDDAGNDENEPRCNLISVFSGRFFI